MVGDWGEPVDKEELDNNIKEDILIGLFCQEHFFWFYRHFVSTFFLPADIHIQTIAPPQRHFVPLSL